MRTSRRPFTRLVVCCLGVGVFCLNIAAVWACSIQCRQMVIVHNGMAGPPPGMEYNPFNAFDNLQTINPGGGQLANGADVDVRDRYDTYTVCNTGQEDPTEGYDSGGEYGPWVTLLGQGRVCFLGGT